MLSINRLPLFISAFTVFGVSDISYANQPYCAPIELDTEERLDSAFIESRFAFVATAAIDESDSSIFNYMLHRPALKGEIPAVGKLNRIDGCSFIPLLHKQAILLFFLKSLDEPVSQENAVLVALSSDGPGYTWVVEWLKRHTPHEYNSS